MTLHIRILLVRDPELVKRIGVATALELRATGIPYTFAPCLAVSDKDELLLLKGYNDFSSVTPNVYRSVETQDGVGVMRATVKILK